jgi:hypothetical protein
MKNKTDDIKSISIRMPEKLLEDLHYVAEYDGRSVNSQVVYLIRRCVADFKALHNDIE